jgi:Glutamate synthase central domain
MNWSGEVKEEGYMWKAAARDAAVGYGAGKTPSSCFWFHTPRALHNLHIHSFPFPGRALSHCFWVRTPRTFHTSCFWVRIRFMFWFDTHRAVLKRVLPMLQVLLDSPILIEEELQAIQTVTGLVFRTFSLYFNLNGPDSLKQAVEKLCADVEAAVANNCEVVILSDKPEGERSPTRPPIPALLAVGAVHHHLIRCDPCATHVAVSTLGS